MGIGVDLGGFGLQVLALGLGTLVFVQPLLVASLLFSLVLGALVGTLRLTRADVGWAVVFMASLSIFLVVAAPSGGVDQRDLRAWALPMARGGRPGAGCPGPQPPPGRGLPGRGAWPPRPA